MLSRLAGDVGRGLLAGAFGTACMTVSSALEAKIRDRGSSSAPADAAGAMLGVEPRDERGEARFNDVVHWGYGIGWGGLRGVLRSLGLRPVPATVSHLGLVIGAEHVMLPATGAAPPATEWGVEEVAIDLWHHLVYATGVAAALAWLTRT